MRILIRDPKAIDIPLEASNAVKFQVAEYEFSGFGSMWILHGKSLRV